MKVERCHLDIESFSRVDLRARGLGPYSESDSTEILCVAFAFNDGPVHLWIPREIPEDLAAQTRAAVEPGAELFVQDTCPDELADWVAAGKKLACHNSQFERTMLNGLPGKKIGFPPTPISSYICTAAKSRAHGLPGALGDVCEALGTEKKSDAGRSTMLQVCRPKKASKADPSTRYTPDNAPDKFLELYVYNLTDVRAERGVDNAVPDLPASEVEIFELDQLINSRGCLVDLPFIEDVLFLIEERRKELAAALKKITRSIDKKASMESGTPVYDEGILPTQREKVANWIRANGWPQLLDMQAETVKALIENQHVPDIVKKVLKIYSVYGMKAVSKYETMRDAACVDGRLRYMFLYHGAGPGRWSALLVQLQNLFRPKIKDPDTAIEAIKTRDLSWIRCLYPDVEPMIVFASCIRGALIPAPGKKFVALDFAGIESRVAAWFAGEQWKLEAFRKQDAKTGPDTYRLAYAKAFQVPVEGITKEDPRRQVGKVMELALGYEGGVGAFVTMTKTYGIKLDELTEAVSPLLPDDIVEEAEWLYSHSMKDLDRDTFVAVDGVKRMWRRAHPKIVELWTDIRDAMYLAVKNPGAVHGIPNKKLMFKVNDRWLYMRLPSGRRIAYYKPEIQIPKVKCRACDGSRKLHSSENVYDCDSCEGTGLVDGRPIITYMGTDTKTRRWMRVSTYGGKALENGDQGFSSCLLRHAMKEVEKEGMPIVMSIHDEIVMEVDENDEGAYALAEECMVRRMPAAYAGLPLAAEGFEARRFRK